MVRAGGNWESGGKGLRRARALMKEGEEIMAKDNGSRLRFFKGQYWEEFRTHLEDSLRALSLLRPAV